MYADFEEACIAVQKAENEFIEVLKQKGYVTDAAAGGQDSEARTQRGWVGCAILNNLY